MKYQYSFLKEAARIINSNQTNSIILSGNVYDYFILDDEKTGQKTASLIELITHSWKNSGYIQLIYE